MGRRGRYRLAVVPQRQGRPHMLAVDAVRAFRRFNVHRAEGLGITEAEDRILEELAGDHNLGSRQAVRYRRNKGAAVEADFAFKEFSAYP